MLVTPPRRRAPLFGLVLALSILFMFSSLVGVLDPPLRAAGRYLTAQDSVGRADFIYVLNGRVSVRSRNAVDLYRRGVADRIVIAGSEPIEGYGMTASAALARRIRRMGVPPEAVELIPGQVSSTIEEARALRRYLLANPSRRVVVATTDYHAGRAGWVIRRELEGLPVEVAIAGGESYTGVGPDNWWKKRIGLRTYLVESAKWLASAVVLTVDRALGQG